MPSSSEVSSDVSSLGNHVELAMKVNLSRPSKLTTKSESLGLLSVQKEMGATTSLGLKPQSNTTSKISHALEVLKKYDNKYKIKPSEIGLENNTKFIDTINLAINITDRSTHVKTQEGLAQSSTHTIRPRPTPRATQSLDVNKLNPRRSMPSEDTHEISGKFQDKTSKDIRKHDSLPEVTALGKGEDYESDFESTDSESLYIESDDAKEVDSSMESKPGSGHRSSLIKPSRHSSETESSIHSVADQSESNVIENVGVFGNMRLFTFSDLDLNAVKKLDERIVPVKLKDRPTSTPNRPTNFERTSDILIPSNRPNASSEKDDKSSDSESIPESLLHSSVSDNSSEPFRRNIFMMDDLNGAYYIHPRQVTLTSHGKENDTKLHRVTAQETQKIPSLRNMSTFEEDIEEIIEDNSEKNTEQHKLFSMSRPRPTTLSDVSYESDYLSDSEINPEQESFEQNVKLGRVGLLKSDPLLTIQGDTGKWADTCSHTMKITTRTNIPIDKRNQNRKDPSAKRYNKKVKTGFKVVKSHLTTRNVSVQTELLESGKNFSDNLREERGRHRVRSSQLIVKPLNLSWDSDREERNVKSAMPFILHHRTLTPEVIEALANQNPTEDALDQVLRQQISLTKIFMASQYKMYQTYCTSVHQLTTQYKPVTLEETKEFIKLHKNVRTNRSNQQVF